MPLCLGVWLWVAVASGAEQAEFTPFSDARPILEAIREDLWPVAFRGKPLSEIEAAWPAWAAERDRAIRARVAAGDDDSIVHMMLFGTSFTSQPRATAQQLAALVSQPDAALAALRPRIDDFLAAVAAPGPRARLQFAQDVLARAGDARSHLEARTRAIASDLRSAAIDPGASAADKLTIFRDRGLSSDTSIYVNAGIEQALQAIADERLLSDGSVRRVAIVGAGLDIIDKQHGYDFYPEQTVQPFAVIDSLRRVGLADTAALRVAAVDVNPRVLDHLRAIGRGGYTVVLPRSLEREWPAPIVEYWDRAGNWIGTPAEPPAAPRAAGRVQSRAVAVRPDVVAAVAPNDLDIVLQRLEPAGAGDGFDVVIATNILLYYDVFEQSLAVTNIARMLRPGGLLLTNTRIVELPSTPLTAVGFVDAIYLDLPGIGATGDRIVWYQKP